MIISMQTEWANRDAHLGSETLSCCRGTADVTAILCDVLECVCVKCVRDGMGVGEL